MLGSLCDIRAPGWALSEKYIEYMNPKPNVDTSNWVPELDYYIRLVKRVVDSILYSTNHFLQSYSLVSSIKIRFTVYYLFYMKWDLKPNE